MNHLKRTQRFDLICLAALGATSTRLGDETPLPLKGRKMPWHLNKLCGDLDPCHEALEIENGDNVLSLSKRTFFARSRIAVFMRHTKIKQTRARTYQAQAQRTSSQKTPLTPFPQRARGTVAGRMKALLERHRFRPRSSKKQSQCRVAQGDEKHGGGFHVHRFEGSRVLERAVWRSSLPSVRKPRL
jgi:hypothetical protein